MGVGASTSSNARIAAYTTSAKANSRTKSAPSSRGVVTVTQEITDRPFEVGDSKCFFVVPFDPVLKQNLLSSKMVLEVSLEGFRLLRADTLDPILVFPWSQVHSWAHSTSKFSFRYFEDRSGKGLLLYSFIVKDVQELLSFMKQKINDILMERKNAALSAERFAALLANMKFSDPNLRINYLQTSAMMNYFTSEQAKSLVASLDNSFDKVEAARILHERLVDQSNFNAILDQLDHADDRDNVWARLSQLKRASNNVVSSRHLKVSGTSSVNFRGSSLRHLPSVASVEVGTAMSRKEVMKAQSMRQLLPMS